MVKKKRKREKALLESPGHVLRPLEVADFIQTAVFTNDWERLRLTDEDLRQLEIAIMLNPKGAPVMKGTSGLRKLRFSPSGLPRGKSRALRACYVYFEEYRLVLLVVVYGKGERDDLSPAGRKAAKEIIDRQKRELSKRINKVGG